MKKVMFILILALFSCKSGKKGVADMDTKSNLFYYSKGPCIGKCPVYNLWVFVDGTVLYREVFMAKNKKVITKKLSTEEIGDLATFLENNLEAPTPFRRIRDRPITILRFDEKEFEYHTSKIDGSLKEVNAKIEALVRKLKVEEDAG